MKAVTWQGVHDMQVTEVPDPRIEEPTDAIIKVTSTGLCGSDLHLYETLAPFMEPGDVVGHEPMGIVEEVGPRVTKLQVGDRVVVPFNVCCGSCWMCERNLYSQCETTQNHEHGTGASFFGYSKLYGQVPGGQAEYLRVPFADFLPVKVPAGARRRPVPVPLRRPAHRVAGSEVRRRARRRHAARARRRPDRRHGRADGRACRAPRDLRRPGARAAGAGRGVRRRGAQPRRRREGRRRGRRRARAHRRPRGRRGHRRRRDGGARVPGRQRRAEVRRACCPTRSPSR